MKPLSAILSFAVLTLAIPSPAQDNGIEAIAGPQIVVGAECNIGQRYCFGQIVGDLGMFSPMLAHSLHGTSSGPSMLF
jgi:hypothetical protein